MKAWSFMVLVDLMIPIMMILFGRFFMRRAPQKINSIIGYRTTMSMKNEETWKFAHSYCGKIWVGQGKIMIVVTLVAMLLTMMKGQNYAEEIGSILCILQCVWIIVTIIPVEKALRKEFDKYGHRRKQSE